MYCDESRGIIPLLIFPDEYIKNSERLMRPINFHPIWFLDSAGERCSENIHLIYKGNIYSAKKFQIFLDMKKRDLERKASPFNMIAIIMVFPKELNYHKKFFSKMILDPIKKDFRDYFPKIIKSETIKEDLVKIPRNERFIKEGDLLKENIKQFLKTILKNHFSSMKYDYEKEDTVNLTC
ncbi:MAG: hypothetical protein ACFFA3_07090 [Promethearchaeota archaeon]